MNAFKKFYVWALNAKLFMAIYFVAIVFLSGLIIALTGGDAIRLIMLVEILIVSMAVAVLQCVLLDDKTDYSRGILFGRSVLWLALSVLITVIAALALRWFSGLPLWCPYALGGFMLFGCGAMLVGLKFEQDADTVRLNADLAAFKEKNPSR